MTWRDFETPPADRATLRTAIHRHLRLTLARDRRSASVRDFYLATAAAVKDYAVDAMLRSEQRFAAADAKRLYYLSMEFLMGRSLGNSLINLELFDLCREVLEEMGLNLEEVRDHERDAALGNGGLGRLAACFLDSLATQDMPGYGYGINYQYGLFKQVIENGYQREKPDHWLADWSPWLIERPKEACLIPLYGRIIHTRDRFGNYNPMWMDWKIVIGMPHDMPVVGYGGSTVNYLRLYSAQASDAFDMQIFNSGDYFRAVRQKIRSETITKVLYPSDTVDSGRELRLVQEYFFVACAIRDIVRRYLDRHESFESFPDKVAIQLNDTHPALAVAELMRLLVDEHLLSWEQAWKITRRTTAYTNHTLMPEALERWPVALFERVLPRHLQIIYEINRRFLEDVATLWPGDSARFERMSIIEESPTKQVRMAHLAIVGSHSVNGVAALHSSLLKSDLVPDFHQMWPEKFSNKTNGVTQRRWLLNANPALADLFTRTVGKDWITDLDALRGIEGHADDSAFQEEFLRIKRENKDNLAQIVRREAQVRIDPDSLFDVQAKRIHEYKRQLLNVMHIIHQYLCITEDGEMPPLKHTYLFAGKAAPGYWAAKQLIKLIHNVARVVNLDPRVGDMLRVAFIPDYRVSLAEKIIPAAEISEQISTAGTEASGTGNMKFALNGALTIGTLDGANIEIREEVGEENIFIFGKRVEEIQQMRVEGTYSPWDLYREHEMIRRVVDTFSSNLFCSHEAGMFHWIFDALLDGGDPYYLLADFESYLEAHKRVEHEYLDRSLWARKSILNSARMGKFSSDRTIREYADGIWNLASIPAGRGPTSMPALNLPIPR